MRTPRQVKAITSQLEVLEELRVQLENIETHIVEVMKKGTSWVEETETQSYVEINQLLSNETAECLRRCYRIADGNGDFSHFSPTKKEECISTESQSYAVTKVNLKEDREHQKLMERLCSIEKSISSLQEPRKNTDENYSSISQYHEMNSSMANKSEADDVLYQKCDDQDKLKNSIRGEIAKMNAKNELKLEELTAQSQAAMCLIADFKKQIVALSTQTNLNVQRNQAEYEEKLRTLMTKQVSAEDKFCLKIDEIVREISDINDNLNKMKSQQESLCNKSNENQEKFNDVCVFADIVKSLHQSVIDQEGNAHTYHGYLQKMEESYKKKFEQMRNEFQATSESLQKLQSECKDFSKKSELFMDDATVNVSALKKDLRDNSIKISSLQTTTDRFITSQTQKTKSMEKKIKEISSQIDTISQDSKTRGIYEVFCAQIDRNMQLKNINKDQIFTFFNNVINIRDSSPNYNTLTGIYTVPRDGLYLVGLMVETNNDVKVNFNIYTKNKAGEEILTAFIHSYTKYTVGSAIMPVTMFKDDLLYVKPNGDYSSVSLGATSFFMCILLNAL